MVSRLLLIAAVIGQFALCRSLFLKDTVETTSNANNGGGGDWSNSAIHEEQQLTVSDQVRLLSNQMSALLNRRREDYNMLENSLKKFVRKNAAQFSNGEIRAEVDKIRDQLRAQDGDEMANSKHRITVQWLSQSITELRSELAELQETSATGSKDMQQRTQLMNEVDTLKKDIRQIHLQIEALRERQTNTAELVTELRNEAVQSEEDRRHNGVQNHFVQPEADHKRRHERFLRSQLHEIQCAQATMRRQLNDLLNHKVPDRIHTVEIEQRRLANANFNLSRQISNFEKLHGSMLELLEDVEGIQNKVDQSLPDIKREIAKLEFGAAQTASEQNLLREENHNAAKSIQAVAVSVSALQDERDSMRAAQKHVEQLENDVQKIRAAAALHKDLLHSRIEKIEADSRWNSSDLSTSIEGATKTGLNAASRLVAQLETVEHEYETIVDQLPHDCSQVGAATSNLFLIAPNGQHRPLMTRCDDEWTTIQRRIDGSVDFNQSWEQYAKGFGSPTGEFWIGNEALHRLTATNCTRLRIKMQDIYDNYWIAEYSDVRVSGRDTGFRLNVNGFTGNASDALDYQNGMEFSASDVDRDISNTNCAANYEGGWWFSHCQHANLNGRYNLGLTWFDASRNEWIAVKSSHIMIAPRDNCDTIASTTENGVMVTGKATTIHYDTQQPSEQNKKFVNNFNSI